MIKAFITLLLSVSTWASPVRADDMIPISAFQESGMHIKGYRYEHDQSGKISKEFFESYPDYQLKDYFAGKTLNLGYTDKLVWIQLDLKNDSHDAKAVWIYADSVYTPWIFLSRSSMKSSNPQWTEEHLKKPENHPGPGSENMVRIQFSPGESKRIMAGVGSVIPLSTNLFLEEETGFHLFRNKLSFAFTLYYGFTLAFCLYGIFLAIFLRKKSYLYFVGCTLNVALCISSTDGILNFLLPSPVGDSWVHLLKFFETFAVGFAFLFTKEILNLSTRNPVAAKFAKVAFVILMALMLLSFTPASMVAGFGIDLMALTLIVYLFWFGIREWRAGYEPARYLVLGWAALMISGGILTIVQFLPQNIYELKFLIYAGSCIDLLLMSIALTSHINIINDEKENALQLAFERQKEAISHLKEVDHLKMNFVSQLEDKVLERTRELGQAQAGMIQMAKWKALGQMANGIAHEINNPLMIIEGLSSHLANQSQTEKPDKEKMKKMTEKIQKTVQRISFIVNQLRLFTSEEQQKELTTYNLDTLLNEVVFLCQQRALPNNMKFSSEFNVKDMDIICRPAQIKELMINLIDNSIDAVSMSHEKWVRVRAEPAQNKVRIYVEDSGAGIIPENQDKIFHPFFTTRPVGSGVGLGLCTAKNIAESHGGSIYLDQSKEFTCFIFEIPCKAHSTKNEDTSQVS